MAPGSDFILVERDGWSKTEVYEAESLEELREFLDEKIGDLGDQPQVEA